MANNAVINLLLNAKQAIDGARSAANSIQQALGAVTMGYGFTRSMSEAKERILEIGRVASNLELPIEEVGKLANMFELTGGSVEGALSAIESLESSLSELRTKSRGGLLELGAIGAVNVGGNALDLIRNLRATGKDFSKAGMIMALKDAGIYSREMHRFLMLSNEEFARLDKTAQSMNIANRNQYEAMERWHQTITRLKDVFISLGAVLLDRMSPALEFVNKGFDKLSEMGKEAKAVVGASLIGLAGGITALISPIKALGVAGAVAGKGFVWVTALYGAFIGMREAVSGVTEFFNKFRHDSSEYREKNELKGEKLLEAQERIRAMQESRNNNVVMNNNFYGVNEATAHMIAGGIKNQISQTAGGLV